jgi:hypothetical protein
MVDIKPCDIKANNSPGQQKDKVIHDSIDKMITPGPANTYFH